MLECALVFVGFPGLTILVLRCAYLGVLRLRESPCNPKPNPESMSVERQIVALQKCAQSPITLDPNA